MVHSSFGSPLDGIAVANEVNESIDTCLQAKSTDSMSVGGTYRGQYLLGLDTVDGLRLDKV